MTKLTYHFNKEFPMPFHASETHLFCRTGMLMNWMDFNLKSEFRYNIMRKMNGENIDMGGFFFIGRRNDYDFSDKERLMNQKADAENSFIYFWADDAKHPKLILKMRGWGHLTGKGGGLGLDDDKAFDIQKGTLEFIRDILNADMNETELVIVDAAADDSTDTGTANECINEDNRFLSTNAKESETESLLGNPTETTFMVHKYHYTAADFFVDKRPLRLRQQPWYVPCINRKHKKSGK